jgi:hypothetical protein
MFNILVNKLTGEVIYDKFRRLGFLLGIPEKYILGTVIVCVLACPRGVSPIHTLCMIMFVSGTYAQVNCGTTS